MILENPTGVRPSFKMQNMSRDLSVIEHERATDVVSDSRLSVSLCELASGKVLAEYQRTVLAFLGKGYFPEACLYKVRCFSYTSSQQITKG